MALIPDTSKTQWTGAGVFVTTQFREDGPDNASTGHFVATDKAALLSYIGWLWDMAAEGAAESQSEQD